MASREKYIFHMLFGGFHITPRIIILGRWYPMINRFLDFFFKTRFRRENESLKAQNESLTLKIQEERKNHEKELEWNQQKYEEVIEDLHGRIDELEEELE